MYFESFPTTIWNNKTVVDISRRAAVLQKVKGDPYAFVPYTVVEGDTIEMIAYHYYGDAKLSWLVMLANDIIDPYCDFFKESGPLDTFIINKYRDQAQTALNNPNLTSQQVLQWTQAGDTNENIIFYFSKYNEDIQVGRKTQESPKFAAGEFLPMRYYDYEIQENEKKRTIKLISDIYVRQIIDEMKTILND
jgi:hypothetical protein